MELNRNAEYKTKAEYNMAKKFEKLNITLKTFFWATGNGKLHDMDRNKTGGSETNCLYK